MEDTMLLDVEMYMDRQNMLADGDRIVIGLSGGPDSVCLLLLLNSFRAERNLYLYAVHVNHNIRQTAMRDESFVRSLCEKLGIPLKVINFMAQESAKQEKLSVEEASRNRRAQAFAEACVENKCTKIALAHNLDDNAETVLFNMVRGTGLTGIGGISPITYLSSGFSIIRPLLMTSKSSIMKYLDAAAVEYCIDETNLDVKYSRNKIRNVVLPYLCENLNSGAVVHMAALAEQARETQQFIMRNVQRTVSQLKAAGQIKLLGDRQRGYECIKINLEALGQIDPVLQKELIRWAIGNVAVNLKDIGSVHVGLCMELTKRQSGKTVHLPYGVRVARRFSELVFERQSDRKNVCEYTYEISENELPFKENIIYDKQQYVLEMRLFERKKDEPIPKKRYTKWFDYDKIRNTISVRSRCEGDYLQILKNKSENTLGKKTLKSYFIDNKIPDDERDDVPLLAVGNDVLWVVGMRSSDGYLVGDDTVHVLEVNMFEGNCRG